MSIARRWFSLFTMLVCILPVCAQEMYEVRSRNYAITTDLPREEIKEIARHMDAVFDAYDAMFSGFPAKNNKPVTLYVVSEREAYMRVLGERGIDGSNSGGMFFWDTMEAGLATWAHDRTVESMHHVLQHEGFHQFAHIHIGGNFPIWANEGLAEYFGASILVGDRLATGLVPSARLERVQSAIREGRTIDFDEFIRIDGQEWSRRVRIGAAETGMLYDQAWSVAYFLVHADNGRYTRAFESFIRDTGRGLTLENALFSAFGTRNLEAFEDAWTEWTLELEPNALSTATERMVFLAEGLKALHGDGVQVDGMDTLRDGLRARGFRLRRVVHGIAVMLNAKDDALFEPPLSDRRGRQTSYAFEPSRDEALPPSITLEGLRVPVRLLWELEDGRRLRYRVVYG